MRNIRDGRKTAAFAIFGLLGLGAASLNVAFDSQAKVGNGFVKSVLSDKDACARGGCGSSSSRVSIPETQKKIFAPEGEVRTIVKRFNKVAAMTGEENRKYVLTDYSHVNLEALAKIDTAIGILMDDIIDGITRTKLIGKSQTKSISMLDEARDRAEQSMILMEREMQRKPTKEPQEQQFVLPQGVPVA